MTTSLAKQLQKLAAPQSSLIVQRKSRASLLFNRRDAALLDRDTVFSLGVDGYEDLLKLNPVLLKFREPLFSESAKSVERAVQTREVNDQLDVWLEEFLCHLSPFFPLKPAHKALEWLVYRFHIHEYNTNALLRCVLPFHDTNMFVRALQLLQLKEPTNRWHWLHPLQDPGVPLAKSVLFARCAQDLGFLKFICTMNKKIIKIRGADARGLHTAVAFYIGALAGMLRHCSCVSESQMSLLLPHLLRGLRSAVRELRTGSCLLVALLSTKSTLTAELTDTLFTAIAKNMSGDLSGEYLASLAVLAHSQRMRVAPPDSISALSDKLDALVSGISDLAARRSVLTLLGCFVRGAVLESAAGSESAVVMVTTLLDDVRLESADDQVAVTRALLDLHSDPDTCWRSSFGSDGGGGVTHELRIAALRPALTLLRRRYPAAWDDAVQLVDRRARPLLAAIAGPQLPADITGATSCIVQLHHPHVPTRLQAAKQLSKMLVSCPTDSIDDQQLQMYGECVSAALRDESDRVVNRVLKVPVDKLLHLLPAHQLMESLGACLDAGHSPQVSAMCSRVLAQVYAARPTDDDAAKEGATGTIDGIAALMTTLLPRCWTQQTAAELLPIAQVICPELVELLSAPENGTTGGDAGSTSTDSSSDIHRRYLTAALSALAEMPLCGGLAMMLQLARRAANSGLPPDARLAAAALCTQLLCPGHGRGLTSHAAGQVLAVIQDSFGQVKVKSGDKFRSWLRLEQLILPQQARAMPATSDDNSGATIAPAATAVQLPPATIAEMYHSMICAVVKSTHSNIKRQSSISKSVPEDSGWTALLEQLFCTAVEGLASGRSRQRTIHQALLRQIVVPFLFVIRCKPEKDGGDANGPSDRLKWQLRFLSGIWGAEDGGKSAEDGGKSAEDGGKSADDGGKSTEDCGKSARGVSSAARLSALLLARVVSAAVPATLLTSVVTQLNCSLLPALLMALLSPVAQVRHAAVDLGQMYSSAIKASRPLSGSLLAFIKHLLTSSADELLLDPETVCNALLVAPVAHVEALYNSCCVSSSGDDDSGISNAVQCRLLQLLAPAVHRLSPASMQSALVACGPLLERMSDSPLDRTSSRLLVRQMALMTTPAAARCLCRQPVWDVFCRALALTAADVSVEDTTTSPQTIALQMITDAWFSGLASKTQDALVTLLVDLCTDSTSSDSTAHINKVLRRITLTPQQLAEQLKEMIPSASKTVKDARNARRRTVTRKSVAAEKAEPMDVSSPPAVTAAGDDTEDVETPLPRQWRRAAVVLEAAQGATQPLTGGADCSCLLAPLFGTLQQLQTASAAAASGQRERWEALRLLVLSALQLVVCGGGSSTEQLRAGAGFSVDTLVQCVRDSTSEHTHRLALVILSRAAAIMPDVVLHNIMAVFTFMGTSMLRQDNEFTFQVIERTLDTVVPALMQATGSGGGDADPVLGVLRVFCDAAGDVPPHRRLPLYGRLLRALGPAGQLWRAMALLLAHNTTARARQTSAVTVSGSVVGGSDSSQFTDLCLSLCGEFAVDTQLVSCNRLLQLVHQLVVVKYDKFDDGDEDEDDDTESVEERERAPGTRTTDSGDVTGSGGDVTAADLSLFDPGQHTDRQLQRFSLAAVTLVSQLLASETFVAQSSEQLAAADTCRVDVESRHRQLLETAVQLITSCSRRSHRRSSGEQLQPTAASWQRHLRTLLHGLYQLLDRVNSLLPAGMFVSIVCHLVEHDVAVVRRKSMELLATRVQHQPEYFSDAETPALLQLLQGLTTVAGTADEAATSSGKGGADSAGTIGGADSDSALNRQTALYAIKLLSKMLAAANPRQFVPVLRVVCGMVSDPALPDPLLASALLCVAELCASLRAHAVAQVSRLSSALLAVLHDQQRMSNDLVVLASVTAMLKLVSALSHFISPYLPDLLLHACHLSARFTTTGSPPLHSRLRHTRHQLASAVPLRVLLPAMQRCVGTLYKEGASDVVLKEGASEAALGQLCSILTDCMTTVPLTQLTPALPQLQDILISLLNCRAQLMTSRASDVERVEGDVIRLLTSLVPRLSEQAFRPLFLRVYEWATEGDDVTTLDTSGSQTPRRPHTLRLITFYRLADGLAETLRGLFVLFAGHFLHHLVSVLQRNNSIANNQLFPDDADLSCQLAAHTLDCLSKVCAHDTESFINKDRFNLITQPLVDQLENETGCDDTRSRRVTRHLVPCIVNFLLAPGDDSLWKTANYQILLKMRHHSAKVRLASLEVLAAVHDRLRDDYMTLLPETMPFFGELLEDEDPAVETQCQKLIQQMEATLGESLQKYF